MPSIDDLKYQRSRCPFCGHNPHKMSSKFYDILYPITLNKSSLLRRGDTSLHSIDIVCGDCHKAIRVVIKTAVQRIIDNSSICWICDHRRGGRTGELFIYNYPELANRIKEEIPNVDFFWRHQRNFYLNTTVATPSRSHRKNLLIIINYAKVAVRNFRRIKTLKRSLPKGKRENHITKANIALHTQDSKVKFQIK